MHPQMTSTCGTPEGGPLRLVQLDEMDEMDEMSILRDHGISGVSMPARRPLRSSVPQPSQKQSPVPRVCVCDGWGGSGGLTAGGHMANRPPGRLCCWGSWGIRGRLLVWKDGRRTAEFSTAQPVRQSVSTVDDVRSKGKSSSSHFASPSPCRPVGVNPRQRLVALLPLHQSLDFGKNGMRP